MEPMGQTPAIRTPATTARRLVALRTAETTSALRYEAVSPRPAETAACDRGAGVAGSSDSTRSTAEHLTAARLRHGRTLREVSRQGHVGVRRRRAPPRPLHPEAPGGARRRPEAPGGATSTPTPKRQAPLCCGDAPARRPDRDGSGET